MSCYGYARVSTDRQARFGVSLEEQQAAIKAYAAAKGLPDPVLFVDAESASKRKFAEKEAGAQLILRVRPGDHVIVTKLDRAWRNVVDFLGWFDEWTKRGVVLHIINFGGVAVDASSPVSRLMVQIMAVFAEFESAMKGERIREAHAHFRAKGLRASSICSVGWKCVKAPGGKGFLRIPDHEARRVMGQMAAWSDRGWSNDQIAQHLRNQGVRIKSRTGRAKDMADWNENSVRKIITAERRLRAEEQKGETV